MKTLVVIGAGFSGALVTVEFLRHSFPGAKVILFNRSDAIARGLAYETHNPKHLLNVPAGNMTALSEDPDSFLRFVDI